MKEGRLASVRPNKIERKQQALLTYSFPEMYIAVCINKCIDHLIYTPLN